MTEERTVEQLSYDFYSAALKIYVDDLRRENPTLTPQQATARVFKEHPEFYDALQKKPAQ